MKVKDASNVTINRGELLAGGGKSGISKVCLKSSHSLLLGLFAVIDANAVDEYVSLVHSVSAIRVCSLQGHLARAKLIILTK